MSEVYKGMYRATAPEASNTFGVEFMRANVTYVADRLETLAALAAVLAPITGGVRVTGRLEATTGVRVGTNNEARLSGDGASAYVGSYGASGGVTLVAGGNDVWQASAAGALYPLVDAANDLGTPGLRVRGGYFSGLVQTGGLDATVAAAGAAFIYRNTGDATPKFYVVDGNINFTPAASGVTTARTLKVGAADSGGAGKRAVFVDN